MSAHNCDCDRMASEARAKEEKQHQELTEVLSSYKGQRGTLIQALHKAQEIYGWLPDKIQIEVAEALGVPVSEVYGVVTFYSFFNTAPKGEHTIRVCLGTACYVRGGKQILEQLQKELATKVGGTTGDRKFSLEVNRCVGACGLAPVVTVGSDIYRRVKLDKVPSIIAKYK